MTHWLRYSADGATGFGVLDGDRIAVHEGDMFDSPRPTARKLALGDVTVLTPTAAGKMIGLWNNYRALATKLGNAIPSEPLYFIKAAAYLASGQTIRRPKSYDGKVIYEGELGVVIGRACRAGSEAEAPRHIFGYTCVNDVTAIDILTRDPSFAQWTRAKSFDTFGVFGPVIATDVDPLQLTIRTILNDQERQNYPASDMVFPPARLVSLISQDLTLEPGDVIACGTSIGVGSMKPGSTVAVSIEGIGTLVNRFE